VFRKETLKKELKIFCKSLTQLSEVRRLLIDILWAILFEAIFISYPWEVCGLERYFTCHLFKIWIPRITFLLLIRTAEIYFSSVQYCFFQRFKVKVLMIRQTWVALRSIEMRYRRMGLHDLPLLYNKLVPFHSQSKSIIIVISTNNTIAFVRSWLVFYKVLKIFLTILFLN